MSKPAFNPAQGVRPNLQFLKPSQVQVDHSYQRDATAAGSQQLIRAIAHTWNWDMCLPLVVSQRPTGEFFVIDGQHRWEAAKLRGDIEHLPCVIARCQTVEDEAKLFVELNQRRRPLSAMDVFKAAVAAGDPEACAIVEAMGEAGLTIAPHSNFKSWKPGMVSNVAGLQRGWRTHGPKVCAEAFAVMAQAFRGEVLRYAGSVFPGIVAICAHEGSKLDRAKAVRLVAGRSQSNWRSELLQARVDDPNLNFDRASARVFLRAWGVQPKPEAEPEPEEPETIFLLDGKAFCDECEEFRTRAEADGCRKLSCPVRGEN